MDLNEYAKSLIEETEYEHQIKSEKRYLIIVEIVTNKRKYVLSNKNPNSNIKQAKEDVLSKFKRKLKSTDIISFRCLEITFADVLIETMLAQSKWEMQPIHSRWMSPEEMRLIINETAGNSIGETTESS